MIQYGFTLWIKPSSVIMFWKATEQYFHVMVWFLHFWCLDQNKQCEHSLESLLLNSTSVWWCLLCNRVWEPTGCSNSSFSCRCFFSLVIIYQIESLISVGILSISLLYNSESIDALGLKRHINCLHDRH